MFSIFNTYIVLRTCLCLIIVVEEYYQDDLEWTKMKKLYVERCKRWLVISLV